MSPIRKGNKLPLPLPLSLPLSLLQHLPSRLKRSAASEPLTHERSRNDSFGSMPPRSEPA